MPPTTEPRLLPPAHVLATTALVMVVTAAATVPLPWATWQLPPDSLEILAIANAWTSGAGFVDPVKWNFYQTTGVPFPAFSLRPPVAIALAAAPLALGGGVAATIAVHAALASVIAGSVVLLARRLMSLSAAVAAALLLGLSPVWATLAQAPMSDVPAVGAFLVVVALAGAVPRSWGAVAGCAAATIVAWATRPSLIVMAPLVLSSVVLQSGWRAAASRRCLAYAASTALGVAALRLIVAHQTGSAPYAGYGFMAEILHPAEPLSYGRQYVGALGFLMRHAPAVVATCVVRAQEAFAELFLSARFLFAGWLLVPGAAYCLLQRDGSIERRLLAQSGIVFVATAVVTYCCFSPRYLILPMVCALLCGACLLDDVAARLAVRRPGRTAPLLRATALLAAAVLITTSALPALARTSLASWSHYVRGGVLLPLGDGRGDALDLQRLCARLEPGAIVATPRPWTVHAWCGNPSVMLPRDLDDPLLRDTFFARERATYVIADRDVAFAWLQRWRGARPIASGTLLTLHRVGDEAPAGGWQAPQPLVCAGRGPECARALRR